MSKRSIRSGFAGAWGGFFVALALWLVVITAVSVIGLMSGNSMSIPGWDFEVADDGGFMGELNLLVILLTTVAIMVVGAVLGARLSRRPHSAA